MKLNFARNDFVRATSWAAGAATPRVTPAGTHAAVIAPSGAGKVLIAGYDAVREARAVMPVATEGELRLVGAPALLLSEMAALMPADRVEISVADSHMQITSGTATFRIQLIDLKHHPLAQGEAMPPFPDVVATASSADLARAVAQTAPSVSKEQELLMIGGINTVIGEGAVTLESTNKYRLTVARLTAETPSLTAPMLVPGADFAKAVKGMRADKVTLRGSSTDLVLTSGDMAMRIRLSSEKFPVTGSLIPTEFSTSVRIAKGVLIDLLRRASLVSGREGQPAAFVVNPAGRMSLTAGEDQVAGVSESADAKVEGRKHSFEVGVANFLSIVTPIRQEEVVLEFTGRASEPIVVYGEQAKAEYFGLVMPVVRNK